MTAKIKDSIKAFFTTGSKPTQSQFTDFIDSYVDKAGPIGAMETACSGGGSGPVIVTNGTPSITTYSAFKTALNITAITTADVSGAIPYATTAQANAGVATGVAMDPVLVKNSIRSLSTSINVVSIQKFSANGTYTPSAGLVYAIVEGVGGGASGGGCVSTATHASGGGGGGGGEYARSTLSAAAIGASKAVTIGAGGNAPATGNNNGSAGGQTSLGSLLIAKGGAAGTGAATGVGAAGGAGGTGGTGDITLAGGAGSNGSGTPNASATSATGGAGGDSRLGAGGASNGSPGGIGSQDGMIGGNYGGGGSGGNAIGTAGTAAGGAGAGGFILITEFCIQ